MAHVTIPDERPFFELDNASTDTFVFTFSYFDQTEIRVTVDYAELAQSAFTITGATGTSGGFRGGTCVLDVAASSENVRIWSEMPPARTSDLEAGIGIQNRILNTELDKLWARARDARLRYERSPTIALVNGNQTLTAAQSGEIFNNFGVTAIANAILPDASPGLHYRFFVVDADGIDVQRDGTDVIFDGSAASINTISSTTIGSTIVVRCAENGKWFVEAKTGTWA